MKIVITLFVAILFSSAVHAQLNLPSASPDGHFKQEVGFTEIEVKYSRPGAKERKIFGALVPFGEIWRTGAHDATTIRFSDTVQVNGNLVPAGTYSLFTIPDENEWTVILNKTTEMHGTSDYKQENDLIRFSATPGKSARFYETFTIEINDIMKDAASLYLLWENTAVKISIETNSDQKVLTEINDRINVKKEDRPSLYYQASMYYFNNNNDLTQALSWIQTANSKTQDAMYLQLQAKIEAALGNYSNAVKTINASMELAKTKKLDQVIAANEKLIQQWNTKINRK